MNTFPNNPANYSLWQLFKYGNVINQAGKPEEENGKEGAEIFEEKLNEYYEVQLEPEWE